jgi:hypothetical protein
MSTATLNANITAAMLGMDSPDDEGYAASDVIGPIGSTVNVLNADEDHWIEVGGFANDPFAVGFVLRADLNFSA